MERPTHVQRQHPPRTVGAGALAEPLEGVASARDDQLAGRIQVGQLDRAVSARDQGAGAPQRVFIQANHTFADALLMTDSAIIRRTPKGTVRRSLQESDINLQPLKRGGSAGGLLIVKRKGAAPDTLYSDLSGREAFRLMNEFTTLQRAQKARDSTSK